MPCNARLGGIFRQADPAIAQKPGEALSARHPVVHRRGPVACLDERGAQGAIAASTMAGSTMSAMRGRAVANSGLVDAGDDPSVATVTGMKAGNRCCEPQNRWTRVATG
jgi:hypothetical protein